MGYLFEDAYISIQSLESIRDRRLISNYDFSHSFSIIYLGLSERRKNNFSDFGVSNLRIVTQ